MCVHAEHGPCAGFSIPFTRWTRLMSRLTKFDKLKLNLAADPILASSFVIIKLGGDRHY